jgi:hypothetical protein
MYDQRIGLGVYGASQFIGKWLVWCIGVVNQNLSRNKLPCPWERVVVQVGWERVSCAAWYPTRCSV